MKGILVLGTGSGSGKSLIATAICRVLKKKNFNVAPFKAQNMSNNAFVTTNKKEIGVAQAIQAFACGIEPSEYMNPILLKPNTQKGSQVIVLGKAEFETTASNYYKKNNYMREKAFSALDKLKREFDIIVAEGAGSPAEINLQKKDFVNCAIAQYGNINSVLIADIDKGGVFASIHGTLSMLPIACRKKIKGIIINKFRGDKKLLQPGTEQIEKLCGIPVLGVIPFVKHYIDDEDTLTDIFKQKSKKGKIDICVVKLPHISNISDFTILRTIEDVSLRFAENADEIKEPDILILPGTKSTISDLNFIYKTGIADKILELNKNNKLIIGICGGFQMLGKVINNPQKIENSKTKIKGLNLLDIATTFEQEKKVTRKKYKLIKNIFTNKKINEYIEGYEIHHGKSETGKNCEVLVIDENNNTLAVINSQKNVMGTYLHDFFNNREITLQIVNHIRELKGMKSLKKEILHEKKEFLIKQIDIFTETFEKNCNIEKLFDIIGIN